MNFSKRKCGILNDKIIKPRTGLVPWHGDIVNRVYIKSNGRRRFVMIVRSESSVSVCIFVKWI